MISSSQQQMPQQTVVSIDTLSVRGAPTDTREGTLRTALTQALVRELSRPGALADQSLDVPSLRLKLDPGATVRDIALAVARELARVARAGGASR